MNRNLIFFSSLFLLQIPTIPIKAAPISIAQNPICKIEREEEFYSTKQLQTLANKITVKVIGDNNGGSGTLIAKQGNNYLVLTNYHVVQGVNSIKLQTADGKTYSAEILPQNNFGNSDITLLKFQSNQNYCLSEISKATPDINTTVLAAGFSGSTGNIIFSEGEVKKTSNLKEGYEIGYNSNIEQGMSGGAIINSMGELVGINGKSSYPILNTGYVYQNGKRPSESEIREMRKLSWGIPISTVLTRVDSDVLTGYKLPEKTIKVKPSLQSKSKELRQVKQKIKQQAKQSPKLTGWLGQLEQKAKQFTVRIDNNSGNGSGIIIAKERNIYTVLTAAHVVCKKIYPNQPCPDDIILAPDGKKYLVDKSSIRIEEGVDLAVVKFNSSENYQIATIADYNPNEDDFTFTAGFPKLNDDSPWRFTLGLIFDKEKGLLNTNQSEFQNNDVGRLQIASSLENGYELVYSNITYGGMSGGPVLDSLGRVIGIHGSADAKRDEKIESGSGKVKIGYSLGIPVSTFLALNSRLGIKPQKLENTRPPQLNAQQKKSMEEAVLSTDVSGGKTTALEWLERGNQLFRLRRYQEAVKAFDEAIKQKPNFVYLAYYGKGLALADNLKESAAALEQAVESKPKFVPALHQQSVVYRELKQLNKALIAINKAIQIEPQNPNLYNEKYEVLNKKGDHVKAEAAITKAINITPRAAFYSNRGVFYSNQKKWKSAVADYNKAIEINPNYFDAFFNRALVYSIQTQYELALADFNKAIQINPDAAIAYYYRGVFYQGQNKIELALANYSKVIKINPEYANAYYNKGLIYHQFLAKLDLAIDNYSKAIELKPNNYEYYNYRGLVYIDQKKWDLALADYNKAIENNREYASAFSVRGLVYMMKGNKQKAVEDLQKAAQLAKAQNNTDLYEMVMNHLRKLRSVLQENKNTFN